MYDRGDKSKSRGGGGGGTRRRLFFFCQHDKVPNN
jgi:hypothetical protein